MEASLTARRLSKRNPHSADMMWRINKEVIMTKEEGAIISAFTGNLCCEFGDFHKYAEKIMGRSVWTHEFASDEIAEKLKELSRDDFMRIVKSQTE